MKLSFWVHLLAIKQVFGENRPTQLVYQHWQERVVALFAVKKNIALTQAHVVKQQGVLHRFEMAHNLVAFENPTQTVEGGKFNQVR
jgi:hypothetical protein